MSALSHLLPYLRRYRLQIVVGLVCVLGMAAVGLLAPLVVGSAVDSLQENVSRSTLLRYAGLILAIALVQGFFSFGQRRILVAVSRHVEYDLRNDYFRHLARLPQSFYQESYTGDLMARATNDLEAVRMVCGPAVMYTANTIFAGTGAAILMARIHGDLTLAVLAILPFVAVASREVGIRVYRHFKAVQEQFSRLSTRVQESFAGSRVVRAYAREEAEIERFRRLNVGYVNKNRGLIAWSAASRPLLQFLLGVGFAVVLGYGGLLTYQGQMTVGELVMFNLFLGKLSWPMISIGWVINLLQRGSASMGRIREVLETVPAIADPEDPVEVDGLRGDVTFRNLTFAYPVGSKPPGDEDDAPAPVPVEEGDGELGPVVLEEIDLAVPAGTTVALVGRTGSGKSTLLSFIPRLVDPPPDTVFIDGIDVRRLPLETLRSGIGMVPQETFLFSATVRENIVLGYPEATEEEILEAASTAGLDRDLEFLPQGLDTIVGERGVTLSGGQKQRVSLARALLRKPAVLILDDSLSAVDTQTEERILRGLRRAFEGRTVFLVSHRISTVKDADVILVLDGGRIVEKGRHDELVVRGGLYAELDQRQQLEEQLEAV